MSVASNISEIKSIGPFGDEKMQRLTDLKSAFGDKSSHDLLEAMIQDEFAGKIALSSSFGAEAAVLLKLVADVDPNLPVLFIDTGHLFEETLQYKNTLQDHLGLTNIQAIGPSAIHLENVDKDATLFERDPDYCCHIRKVLPFEHALGPYEAWISGRKRFQSSSRAKLDAIELDQDGRFKVNPLYNWEYDAILAQFKELGLPKHPLVDKGFPSIGCAPCTRAVRDGESQRAGRWAGQDKNECGIHKSPSFEAIYI